MKRFCMKINKRIHSLQTDSSHKVCKKFKITRPEPPVEFLVIILYAKESIRLMKFKQNPYFKAKERIVVRY